MVLAVALMPGSREESETPTAPSDPATAALD
jgi:hypothetical protein